MDIPSSQCSAPTYQWQDGVEDLDSYRLGGFHPVQLDDTFFEGRYRIVHKLGFGSYSTVWLARDCLADKFVSLKILKAKASEHSREARMINHIAQESKSHLDRRFIPSLCDEFLISGPNGDHNCLVSEALGPTVSQLKRSFLYDLLPLDIAKQVTVQLALGLASVHSCGITHGDIYLKNIAFKSDEFRSWPLLKLYERLGPPARQIVNREDGAKVGPEAPPYAVPPATLLDLIGSPVGEISILDFGEASFTSEPRQHWNTPLALQAPEALLGEPVGQPAEIWAFACTIYDLFNNKSLFECGMPTADDILSEIVDTLGRLPSRWWGKWEQRGDYYEEDGTKKIEELTEEYQEIKPLALRLRRMRSSPPAAREIEQLSEEDIVGLQGLLERCFRYEPAERATMKEVLDLEWIRKIRETTSEV